MGCGIDHSIHFTADILPVPTSDDETDDSEDEIETNEESFALPGGDDMGDLEAEYEGSEVDISNGTWSIVGGNESDLERYESCRLARMTYTEGQRNTYQTYSKHSRLFQRPAQGSRKTGTTTMQSIVVT